MPKWCKIISRGQNGLNISSLAEGESTTKLCGSARWVFHHPWSHWRIGLFTSSRSVPLSNWKTCTLKDSCPRQTSWAMIPNLKEISKVFWTDTRPVCWPNPVGTPQAWKQALHELTIHDNTFFPHRPLEGSSFSQQLASGGILKSPRAFGAFHIHDWLVYTCVNIGLSNPEWHRTQAEAALNAQLAKEEAIRNEGGTWDILRYWVVKSRNSHGLHDITCVLWFFSDVSLPLELAYSLLMFLNENASWVDGPCSCVSPGVIQYYLDVDLEI